MPRDGDRASSRSKSRSPRRHRSRERAERPPHGERQTSTRDEPSARPRSRSRSVRRRSRSAGEKRRSRSPARKRLRSRSASRDNGGRHGRDRRRSRSRSRERGARRKRSRDRERSVSSSASSEDGERKRKERRKDKDSKRSKSKERRKERKREKREKKEKKKQTAGTSAPQWGKYGIISEVDIFSKSSEFYAWLVEERKINPETITKDQNKKEFVKYVEDFNTATLPHEKYYHMEAYERRMSALRQGEFVPPPDDSYDPQADMKAISGAHKKKVVEHESYLSKDQLLALRKVQHERIEAGKMKLLGMDVKQNMGVRMDGTMFDG